ncbi:MAG: universal stress protein, partial [Candidatus Methylomirabilales bacterium]
SAEAACRLGARLAMRAEAGLILFHALSGFELVEEVGRGKGKTQVEVLHNVRERMQRWFEMVVPEEFRQFLSVEIKVKVGEPLPGITWAATRSDVDLILMGTHGRTGLAHLVVGSVTEAVLRAVPVPVLALRPGEEDRTATAVQRILWATDLSPVSERGWRYTLTLANLLGADVILIHVVHPNEFAGLADQPAPPPKHWMERYLAPLERELEQRGRAVEAQRLNARWKVLVGVPAEVIVRQAQAEEADLIVVGTHGRTGLRHVVLGSVAETVIRKAPCPVLAVKAKREGEEEEGEQHNDGAPGQAELPGGS